jgi:O-antigen/teichoic acid export membrane protein
VLNSVEVQRQPARVIGTSDVLAVKAATSAVWVFALNFINRGSGLMRTVILARLLTPDDFGLLGLALLITATLETLSQTGFHGAIIQRQGQAEGYLNTAWTCSALRGAGLFVLLCGLAPQLARFFEDARMVPIIRVIAVSILLSGFGNIGVVFFRKNLEFKKLFIYETLSNMADIVTSIALAVWLRNVWALVIGGVVGHSVRLILSYGLHPHRPAIAFDVAKFKELVVFGKWMLAAGILHFMITKADDLFVGKCFGVAALGLYQMAFLLSNVTTTDLVYSISQIAFPAYSKIQHDRASLTKAYLKVLRGVAFAAVSVALILFAFAPEFVNLFLGEQWMPMVPVLEVLALAGLARSIQATAVPVFLAVNRPKIHSQINFIRAAVLFACIYPLAQAWGVLGVAYAVLASCVVSVLAVSLRIPAVLELRASTFYLSISAPLLPAGVTLVAVMLAKQAGVESGTWRFFLLPLLAVSVHLTLSLMVDGLLKYGVRQTIGALWQHVGLGKTMRFQKAGRPS